MARNDPNQKSINLRINKETWTWLKRHALDREMSMNEIILKRIVKYKERIEKKKLTDNGSLVE
jgi:hypothetical protein